jgi:hypothetical protein
MRFSYDKPKLPTPSQYRTMEGTSVDACGRRNEVEADKIEDMRSVTRLGTVKRLNIS